MLPKNNKKENLTLLGAHYYLWYGRPVIPVQGGGIWKSGYTDHPVLGEYNSRDEKAIKEHINWAKEAEIDFFIINWNDSNSWDDITLKNYFLRELESSRIKFCLHYDGSLALTLFRNSLSYDFNILYSPNKTKGEKFLEDFEYLARNYFKHSQYLKINGKPVVIIYNVSAFKNSAKYFKQLKIRMAKKGIILFLVADVVCWSGIRLSRKNLSFFWENSPKETIKIFWKALRRLSLKNYEKDFSLSKYFNAITGYNMYSVNRITSNFLENVEKVYQKFYNYAQSNNLCFIPTIMPGYDDRRLKGENRPVLKRESGKFYKKFWQITKKYFDPSLKMALITSFNEWHEGTEIEPSREYGDRFIELTKLLKSKK